MIDFWILLDMIAMIYSTKKINVIFQEVQVVTVSAAEPSFKAEFSPSLLCSALRRVTTPAEP